MKTSRLFLLFIFFAGISASAQWMNCRTDNIFYGACFAKSADTCIVIGSGGYIFRTPDGCATWDSVQTIFTTSWFNDITFSSASTGYACGGTAFGQHTSMIAKTNDGGITWDSLTSNTFGFDFSRVFCLNDSICFFTGQTLVMTNDGGQTFSIVPTPVNAWLNTLWFFNDSSGLIATEEQGSPSLKYYKISLTTDRGLHWTTCSLDSTSQTSTIFGSKQINKIFFTNAVDGYAVGDNGIYMSTNNGGLNWSYRKLLNDSTHLKDIEMSKTSGTGYIAGYKYTGVGQQFSLVLKTTDYGQTWQENFNIADDGLFSISMVTDDIVYAAGYGNLYKTTNGGSSAIPEIENPESGLRFYAVSSTGKLRVENFKHNMSAFEVFDSSGKNIYAKSSLNANEMILDVSTWKSGIYIAKVKCEGKFYSQKFIVN